METKVIWNQKAIDNLIKKVGDNLEEIGQYVEDAAKANLDTLGAVDTGNLKDSITHVTDKQTLNVKIGTDVKYAPYVELGTSRLQPRPFLRLALYESTNKIVQTLKK